MSPIILWLLFTLDKVLALFSALGIASIVYLVVMLLVWLISACSLAYDYREGFRTGLFKDYTQKFSSFMKKWNILAIVFLSVSLIITTFVPNTKESIVIVVIPKVLEAAKDNKQLMQIPDKVLTMANVFMDKKIKDWTKSVVGSDTTTVPVDSEIVWAKGKLKELDSLRTEFNALKERVLKP